MTASKNAELRGSTAIVQMRRVIHNNSTCVCLRLPVAAITQERRDASVDLWPALDATGNREEQLNRLQEMQIMTKGMRSSYTRDAKTKWVQIDVLTYRIVPKIVILLFVLIKACSRTRGHNFKAGARAE